MRAILSLKSIAISIVMLSLAGCEQTALTFTPKKQAITSNTPLSQQAEEQFWRTLHSGRYEDIHQSERLLMAAYLQNPNDPRLAAHIGFLHIWKITERARQKQESPFIVDEIILAKKYFKDAVELNPSDPRYLGFLGASQLVEGKIFNDQREQVRGYFTLKQAMKDWPQFNCFTAGYPMSVMPAKSKEFKEGLEWQWQTMDLCAKEKVNRRSPSYAPYMKLETQNGPARACWDSWIAPHNFEGFFLNMGDMLVKSGDWQAAIPIYENARLAKNYSAWPYKFLLDDRIAHAKENVVEFRKNSTGPSKKSVLFNSGYGCVACHQRGSVSNSPASSR